MPQLDTFGYVSQVIWLSMLFLILYIVVLEQGLSKIYKVLFFRKKKIDKILSGTNYVLSKSNEELLLDKNIMNSGLNSISKISEEQGVCLVKSLLSYYNNFLKKSQLYSMVDSNLIFQLENYVVRK